MNTQQKIEHIANHYGYKSQYIIAIEEMSELTKAICKYERAEEAEKSNAYFNIIEEVADVEIMIRQLKHFLGAAAVDTEIEKKLDRQLQRINEEEENE